MVRDGSGGDLMDAFLGLIFAVSLLVVTAYSWKKLFQSKSIGTVSSALWILLFVTGNASWIFGLSIFGWTAYLNREWILSWYYSLTPHPVARVYNSFNIQPHLISRPSLRILRARANRAWEAATVAA